MAEHQHVLEADVAVVGAGPAGIAAATRAAEAGRRVLVVDEGLRPGGQIWRHRSRGELPPLARRWLARLDASGASVLAGASVVDAAPGRLAVERAGEPLVVRAGALVLAVGARELFLPFPGWTLPGVVGVGGAQALLKSGAPLAGRRVVVGGSGPLLLPVAAALSRAGARVALVAEQAPRTRALGFAASLWRTPGKLAQAARYRAAFAGTRYRTGAWVAEAHGTDAVRAARLSDGRRHWTVPCDLLCVGYGLLPAVELPRLLGCAVEDGRVVVDALQRTSLPDVYCAGEASGVGGADAALLEGEIAGLAAAGRPADAAALLVPRDRWRAFADRLATAFAPRPELRTLARDDTIVCRCEDVPLGRLRADWSAREAKLYTRAGMGACQARVCGAALRTLFGWEPDTPRPLVVPAAVDTLTHAVPSIEEA